MPMLSRNRADAHAMDHADARAVADRLSVMAPSAATIVTPAPGNICRSVVISTGPDGVDRYATGAALGLAYSEPTAADAGCLESTTDR